MDNVGVFQLAHQIGLDGVDINSSQLVPLGKLLRGQGACLCLSCQLVDSGNHFIHGCSRNVDLTVVLFNNSIYGMTGGQSSPMTPTHKKATTAPYGAIDRNFDACKLAEAAGATYVARSTAFHVQHLTDMIASGIDNKGFSFIEAIVQCPTAYGRKNKMADPAQMMMWMRDNAIMKAAWDKLPDEKKIGEKFPIGLMHHEEATDYATAYEEVIELAGGKA